VEVNINNREGLNAVLSVKVQESDYKEDFEKSLKEYGRKMNVPGFRQGKVPTGIVKKMIGKDAKRELVEKFLQKNIQEYLDTNSIKLVLSPLSTYHAEDIDWMQNDLEFTYDIGFRPEIKLDLKPLNKLSKYVVTLTDAEVKEDVKKLRMQSAKLEKAEFYDYSEDYYVSVKFTEIDENEAAVEGGVEKVKSFRFDNIAPKLAETINGQSENYETKIKIADIFSEKEIAALFEIDEMSVKDLFPEFKITVLAVMKANPPEMNQEFFNNYFPDGKVTSEEEFYTEWKTIMEQYYISQSDNILGKEVKKSLLAAMDYEMPEEFIKKYFLLSYDKNEDGEIEEYDKKYDSFKEELKWLMLSEYIAEQNAIEISEDDVIYYTEDMIRNELGRNGYQEMEDKKLRQYAIDYLTKENNFNRTSLALRDGRVFDWLLKQIDPKKETIAMKNFEELKNNQ
jgi:trigger factor